MTDHDSTDPRQGQDANPTNPSDQDEHDYNTLFNKWNNQLMDLLDSCNLESSEAGRSIERFAQALDEAFIADEIPAPIWLLLTFTCTSVLINVGCDANDVVTVEAGINRARSAVKLDIPTGLEQQLKYNIGNGLYGLHDIDRRLRREAQITPAERLPFALEDRIRLRESRALLGGAGYHSGNPAVARGMALCNLANGLDESGRWVEAYQAYADALAADPTNGNAAGNAAELLRRRIFLQRGMDGHYAAVYNKFVYQAQSHRDRTVEVAGEKTAQRWDQLSIIENVGHLEHPGDVLDDYQQWIKDKRVALTIAVEGLGSDDPRWDVAMVKSVTVDLGEPDPPVIFASMNVLKAEYLTARRLAYQGERWLQEAPESQHPNDSGSYVDTLDMSLYGESSAMLILAQRATLDLLDKIAVAANDHFAVGISPSKVNFRNFWLDEKSNTIRRGLPISEKRPSAATALAELSHDLDEKGLYPYAQTLRNAGTHRLVRLTHGNATGVTKSAHSSVSAEHLIEAAHESLRVARAAYIYLIDLVEDGEDEKDDGELRVPLLAPSQH